MGAFANSWLTNAVAVIGMAVVLLLNAVLILQTFGLPIPGF
jgi:manganese transport protein